MPTRFNDAMFVVILFWLLMLAFVLSQIVRGFVLDGGWQPWYYRKTQPGKFWAVVTIQCLMLIVVAAYWFVRHDR